MSLDIIIRGEIIRDFHTTIINGGNQTIDTLKQFNAVGLDFYIRNTGAAALTVRLSGQAAVTVDAGDVYTLNGIQFDRIDIISVVNYDCQIFGLKYTTLKRMRIV